MVREVGRFDILYHCELRHRSNGRTVKLTAEPYAITLRRQSGAVIKREEVL